MLPVLGVALALLVTTGCGGGEDAAVEIPVTPSIQSPETAPPAQVGTAVVAPPTGTAPAVTPASAEPDLFGSYKATPDGKTRSDVEAMQAIVDGYAFGPDGLGVPPLNSLDELVTKGYLKKLPPPPQGMKWAYDSQKWKVSVVPQ